MSNNELDWETAIIHAINHSTENYWGKPADNFKLGLIYDGKIFPPKEIHRKAYEYLKAKDPSLDLPILDNAQAADFLPQHNFCIVDRKLYENPGTRNFMQLLKSVDSLLGQKYGSQKLAINKKHQKDHFAWASDSYQRIGSVEAHYELIRRRANSNSVFLELHFEGSSYPKELVNDILETPREKRLISQQHDGRLSIQYPEKFYLGTAGLAEKVVDAMIDFDQMIGDEVRRKVFSFESSKNNVMEFNQILYGPPGTGKTYHTINEALKIVSPDEYKTIMDSSLTETEKRTQLTALYKDLLIKDWNNPGKGQIVFTTFHQSLGYEDFIEGIKPKMNENNEVIYEIEDGLFKRLCLLADQKNDVNNFETAYAKFAEDVLEQGSLELTTFSQKKVFDVEINGNLTAVAIPRTNKKTRMSVTKEMIRTYLTTGEIRDWKPYITAIGSYIKEKYNLQVEQSKNHSKQYVIVMDEINRGNVSSIFGELITLIEPSKRKGMPEELEVILPYSKKSFQVPRNVFLIGTMNTADRSVESLDTALRRRFSFQEKAPEPEVLVGLTVEGIEMGLLLRKINDRLAKLIDYDHQIGHAYFIGIDSIEKLRDCFHNKILPLLAEYFYGELGKVGLVLGSSFVRRVINEVPLANFEDYDHADMLDLSAKALYQIKPVKDWDFASI